MQDGISCGLRGVCTACTGRERGGRRQYGRMDLLRLALHDSLLDASPHLVLPDHIIAWVSQYPPSSQWPDGPICATAAGERGKRRVSIVASWGGRHRASGRLDHSVVPHIRLLLFCSSSGSLDSACRIAWIFLLLLRTPTAAPSRARFCLCGNHPRPAIRFRQVEAPV